jgi:23S rRNA (cytidine1920-2'-O)/16S rRNA (cytidine1409-2'-O)-methyltransferase
VGRKGRARLRKLRDELVRAHPSISDPDEAIARGRVLVGGRVMSNPESLVRQGVPIALRQEERLRGEAKLAAALATFQIDLRGRVALDVGAAAGGFTRVLLEAGVRRVYAVDAGHGQLLGSLRQDPRVVNLEATNLGELTTRLVPDVVELVTVDLSYLALREAVPQFEAVRLAVGTHAIALVKPQFELGLAEPPRDPARLAGAIACARDAFHAAGWQVVQSLESPVRGGRGAIEFFLHALRRRRPT